jgi:hypothetical protein
VSAIDGENQELGIVFLIFTQVTNINPRLGRHAVPRLPQRVSEGLQPGFIEWELADLIEGDGSLADPKEVTEKRNAQNRGGNGA